MALAHVTLAVADVARSRSFYLAFGLTLIVDEAHYCRFDAGGGATLSVHRHEDGASDPLGGVEIGFEFDSPSALDERVAALTAAGLNPSSPVDQTWLWRESRLRDPDGHTLLLFHAGINRHDPPWRVRD